MVRCFHQDEECRGPLQAMHYISAQRITIKRRNAAIARGGRGFYTPPETEALLAVSLDDLLSDSRNSLVGCEIHHGRFDRLGLSIPPPLCVIEFAEEFGLSHLLPESAEAA